MKMMSKNFLKTLLFFVIIFGLISANSCLAAITLEDPADDATDTPLTHYFVWKIGKTEYDDTTKFVLDIQGFTQSEDNIPPSKCPVVLGETVECSFGFLELTIGSLNYFTTYSWRITAYDANGDSVSASPGFFSFTTEPSSPKDDNGNGPNGTNGNGWKIIEVELENPLDADNIWEAIDAIINWLFFLSFVIAPILIIYAAFLLMFRGDDPKEANRAKTIILWTLLALALILFAKGLPAAMKGALGG